MGGRHLPPDYSAGDERTLGGYMAVHARPPAFEGSDGLSYSVDIAVDETGEPNAPVGAYLLFVRWSRGEPGVAGHLESEFLVKAPDESSARSRIGAMPLDDVKQLLDSLIASHAPQPTRPWWEVMRDEDA
jgi:hypothetical protein